MVTLLKQQAETEGEFYLTAIKRAIHRQKPWFSEDLDCYYCFLSTKGGGVEGVDWKKFVVKHTAFVTPSIRSMPGQMFHALADFTWLFLPYAVLLTAYTCPVGTRQRQDVLVDRRQAGRTPCQDQG